MKDDLNIEPTGNGEYKVGTGPLGLEAALRKRQEYSEAKTKAQKAEQEAYAARMQAIEDRKQFRKYMWIATAIVFVACLVAGYFIGINL